MDLTVVVLVSLLMVNSATSAEDNLTTLDEFFLERYQQHIHELSFNVWAVFTTKLDEANKSFYERLVGKATTLPLTNELMDYLRSLKNVVAFHFATVLEDVTAQSIYEDLNDHCSEYLDTRIVDFRVEPSNTGCVMARLRKTLVLKLKTAVGVGLQQLSRQCTQKRLAFCSAVNVSCTQAYEERVGQLITGFIDDANDVEPVTSESFVEIIADIVVIKTIQMAQIFVSVDTLFKFKSYFSSYLLPVEPFAFENLIHPLTNQAITADLVNTQNNTMSQDELTWGIVRSNTATVDLPCSNYRDIYSDNYEHFLTSLFRCYHLNMFKSNIELMRCAYADPTTSPLTWSTVPSIYVNSQCLCLASDGNQCGVKALEGVDPRFYCLFVLLRDFQRQVLYRPAVTYLDYAFQTRVHVCTFTNFIQVAFRSDCENTAVGSNLDYILSLQCYFKDLVNKHLKCTETLLLNTYNHTALCGAKFFMHFVLCDNITDIEVRVPYYGAGDSTLVLVLTYVDVAVRVFTLVTYLACPQLRNLPGKLLIGYQVTALLRLVVVRASLADMALTVRLDVALDLATTLWLTANLHFLTVCIETLRPPDTLTPDEARVVLLRYALFGWVMPTALSVAFFWINEALDSHVQFGQLGFVLCNYLALFANLFMFFKNCHFYYDVKSNVRLLQQGISTRSVFVGLFRFAMKMSLLSGAGITFRLVFTQIQGLEQLLGYYHALGTLQGLLLFGLYGCNRDARDFWLRVYCSTLSWRPRR